jgi:hypothetical protein
MKKYIPPSFLFSFGKTLEKDLKKFHFDKKLNQIRSRIEKKFLQDFSLVLEKYYRGISKFSIS